MSTTALRPAARLVQTQIRILTGGANRPVQHSPHLNTITAITKFSHRAAASAAFHTQTTHLERQPLSKVSSVPPPSTKPPPPAPGTNQSSQSNESGSASGNPELPAFSFEGLGIGPKMKIFIIGIICVFGTMETWFYCTAIWRWWKGEQTEASRTESDG